MHNNLGCLLLCWNYQTFADVNEEQALKVPLRVYPQLNHVERIKNHWTNKRACTTLTNGQYGIEHVKPTFVKALPAIKKCLTHFFGIILM